MLQREQAQRGRRQCGPAARGRLAAWSVVILFAALQAFPPSARAQQVFVGSGNGWQQMSAHPDQWTYVRQNADGFYINFIELLHTDAATLAKLSPLFTHRNAYYESDSRNTGLGGFPDGGQFTRTLQAKELGYLLSGGFSVPYTSLNYGLESAKEDDLKHTGLPAGRARPCFTQCGPWTYGGDITSETGSAPEIRANIGKSDGASTDGPLSLWHSDQGHMQSGSFSLVKYVHGLHKTAAVMVAPYDLKPRSQWLAVAQQCVRQHEDAGARPDIWIVFEYATDTPTLPETVNGRSADTITGMAYWLIHHIKDPQHRARLIIPALPPTHGAAGRRETTVLVRNDSRWMDLCPVVFARVHDPEHAWNVRFRLGGQDVTRQMVEGRGLPFIGGRRLWPGTSRRLRILMERKHTAASDAPPVVQIGLRPNPSAEAPISQLMALRPAAPHPGSVAVTAIRDSGARHGGRAGSARAADRSPA